MTTVFVSDAVEDERLAFSRSPASISVRFRRWKELSGRYQASLVACGFGVERVLRPEIYQTEAARRIRNVSAGDWHLAVKPIEHIRPFHGIPNVFVCDWPYPEISTSSHGISRFFHQPNLLKAAQVVACCTDFTAQTLRTAGLQRVITLPPYIPVEEPDNSVDNLVLSNDGRRTFVTTADVERPAREVGPTIEGFRQAQAQHGNLRLVIKLLGGEPEVSAEFKRCALKLLSLSGSDDAISFAFDIPGNPSLPDLLRGADFFVCASPAEGLPLPLVQAVLAKVPLVTTMESGIGSILPHGSAVTIPTTRAAADEFDEPMARVMTLTCNRPTAEGICGSIMRALDLDDAARAEMTKACRQVAERRFGLSAFKAGLECLKNYVPMQQ
jgi:glycosyltransferase involved in cell wall biosynthesis